MNPPSIHEDTGSIPGPTQWVKYLVFAMSCGVGRRCDSDLALLWLWHRLAATAPIQPLAWELPYVTSAALKRERERERDEVVPLECGEMSGHAKVWVLVCIVSNPFNRQIIETL